MAKNVRFIQTTKEKYLSRGIYDEFALYFCIDTNELFKGSSVYTDGIRIVETKADLPECSCAADGTVYYIRETRNGYTLSPDRTEWLQTIYAPVTDAYIVPESEIYNTVTTVGAVRDIEKKIYEYVDNEIVAGGADALVPVDGSVIIKDNTIDIGISEEPGNALTKKSDGLYVGTSTSGNYAAGSGLQLVDGTFSIKLADTTHGLQCVDGAMSIALATKDSDGAMSAEDKLIVDSIPSVYIARKYEISDTPIGTLVNYGEKEIRVMCPADAEFVKQNVGVGGDASTYYMTLRTYAPQGAVGYKEHLGNQSDSEVLTDLKTDEYGRKYQPTWLGLAKCNEATGVWTYYGKSSSEDRYIGWDYRIDWFDQNGTMIYTDSIRINLSNEDCHTNAKPYYMAKYATSDEMDALVERIDSLEGVASWEEL